MRVQHRQHVSSLRELELKRLLASLQETSPAGSEAKPHPINTLHSITEELRLPGYDRPDIAEQMRMGSIKV